MIGKVKKWLGIEGVKLELDIPGEINSSAGIIMGKVNLYSQLEQEVEEINFYLIEKYERGRSEDRRIDEYLLGELHMTINKKVPSNGKISIPFELPFALLSSEMDELGDRNFMLDKAVGLAKWLNKVKSTYRIEAEAKVKGTFLSPFDKKQLILKK